VPRWNSHDTRIMWFHKSRIETLPLQPVDISIWCTQSPPYLDSYGFSAWVWSRTLLSSKAPPLTVSRFNFPLNTPVPRHPYMATEERYSGYHISSSIPSHMLRPLPLIMAKPRASFGSWCPLYRLRYNVSLKINKACGTQNKKPLE
jgi:hypothetical protein